MSDSKWGMPHQPVLTYEDWDNPYGFGTTSTYHCDHKWVNTGTLKSFCKHCDADGEWDSEKCEYKLVVKEKTNGNP